MVAEGITRLGVSLILAPEGPIPIYDDKGLRAYVARYLVPGIARLAESKKPAQLFDYSAVLRAPAWRNEDSMSHIMFVQNSR